MGVDDQRNPRGRVSGGAVQPRPDRARRAKEATYRFMTAIAGDLPGYEEATRMLFAGDWTAFDGATEAWPEGVREMARGMAAGAWRNGAGA